MALLVYITDNCLRDAGEHGLNVELDRFRARVEETQSTSLFDPFPPPYLVKKKLGGRQGRLIADRRTVGEHAVIVFLTILMRGSRAYEVEFAADPLCYGKQHLAFVTDSEIARFVDERTRLEPPPIKPDPTTAEYELLYSAFSHHQTSSPDDLVCETKEWVEQVSVERISMQLVLFRKACEEGLSKGPGLHFVPLVGKQNWGIWVLRSPDRLLLLTPVTDANATEAELLAKSLASQLSGKDQTTVLRSSRRAYPAFILADDELWIALEKELNGNMALSPEESEVLESARRSDHPFPLFINGRAGSGKSTILQYLFADLLFFYLSRLDSQTLAPPIYLTANGELLRMARTFVERLLRSEAIFTTATGYGLIAEHREVLDSAFREFQPYLLSLVPPEARRLFARASRVDYARFRRMWMDRFGKEPRAFREFGPDLSWHIIRSYIKGMSSETFLEPEDYIQLPENQITVTPEAFKVVYDRVWTGWYLHVLEAETLWDDQDLTRYILDSDLARPIYSAVLCDEAQDFTRLELELLLRLNLFSNRSLRPSDIHRVPFAFAGDQFQTLNPTGFRWDSIKASFVEKFIFELDPTRRSGRVDLNYRELKYNYRSTHRIVCFGNHVQALRAALFELPDLKPQMPWTTEPKSLPVTWFYSSDGAFWKKFRDDPGFVVIVPCAEGEEAEFVKNDPVLRERIKVEEGVPVNVLSAGRAKGCEYPAVIVYGFGAETETNLMSELEEGEKTSDPDRSLPIQYFVNRLYVAVSRPKRRLVVVDTAAGFQKLWRCAQEEGFESQMLEKIKNGREVWGEQIEGMNIGNPEDLARESAGDPLENAITFEADGIARRDGFLLRQAAHAYRIAGDTAKARECRARALEADGNWYDAGDAYFEAGFAVPEGVRCLWHSGKDGWTRLVDELPRNPQIQNELEFAWARAIIDKPGVEAVSNLITRFANQLNDNSFMEASLGDNVWRDALAAVLQPLTLSKQPAVPEGDEIWARIALAIDRVRAKGLGIPSLPCAQVYFLAKRYVDALALWTEAGETALPAYDKAKAAVAPYPERIGSLTRLGSHQEIIDSYRASPGVELSLEQAAAVSDAFREVGLRDEAYSVARNHGIAAPIFRLVRPALQVDDSKVAVRALHAGLALLVKQGQWDVVTKFASSLEFTPTVEWKDKDLKILVLAETNAMQVTLVRALARSVELLGAAQNVQQGLGSFLRKYLRVKEGSWKPHLSVAEAGAAIERVGRFTDAISFYDAIIKDSSIGANDRRFARQRWVVSKQRQLEYERGQRDEVKVKQIEHDIDLELSALRIAKADDLEKLPALPPFELPEALTGSARELGTTQPPSPMEFQASASPVSDLNRSQLDPFLVTVGTFTLAYSSRNRRCNISHAETMETAYIKLDQLQCGGEVEFRYLGNLRWICDSWKLTVKLPETESEGLSIDLEQSGVQLHLKATV